MQWNGLLKRQLSENNRGNAMACLLRGVRRAMGWVSCRGIRKKRSWAHGKMAWAVTLKRSDKPAGIWIVPLTQFNKGVEDTRSAVTRATAAASKSAQKDNRASSYEQNKTKSFYICLRWGKSFVASFFTCPLGKQTRGSAGKWTGTISSFMKFCFYWAYCFK